MDKIGIFNTIHMALLSYAAAKDLVCSLSDTLGLMSKEHYWDVELAEIDLSRERDRLKAELGVTD